MRRLAFLLQLKSLVAKSNKILLQLHREPDADSIGSVIPVYNLLKKLHKEVKIISPSPIDQELLDLFPKIKNIVDIVDFNKFDFSKYELFIINDTASAQQLSGIRDFKLPDINLLIIDHHVSNIFDHKNCFVDSDFFSNTQLIFNIFKELKLKIDSETATYFLAGMLTDTFFFKVMGLNEKFYKDIAELLHFGGNIDFIMKQLVFSNPIKKLNAIGKALESTIIKKGRKYNYAICLIDNKAYNLFGRPEGLKNVIAEQFIQSIEKIDFGIVILEKDPGVYGFSIRSVTKFNCAELARKIGGGGHKNSAGGLLDKPLNEALNVLNEY
jgi:phosphoesterase RecJ-like protein